VPFHPQTKINRIAVGNEILATSNKSLIAQLLPAMKELKSAFDSANVTDVQVSMPHSLGILSSSEPPSFGRFRSRYDKVVFSVIEKGKQRWVERLGGAMRIKRGKQRWVERLRGTMRRERGQGPIGEGEGLACGVAEPP
jgi:hypothetical protein